MEAGFEFNTSHNGMPIERFKVGPPPKGRHAYHPQYTKQIREKLKDWVSSQGNSYTPQQAKEFLDDLTTDIRAVINTNPTVKINELAL